MQCQLLASALRSAALFDLVSKLARTFRNLIKLIFDRLNDSRSEMGQNNPTTALYGDAVSYNCEMID